MNGILWVLRTGAPWADLPDQYPSFQACHRRFQQWVRSGLMTKIMAALANEQASAALVIDISTSTALHPPDQRVAPVRGGKRSFRI